MTLRPAPHLLALGTALLLGALAPAVQAQAAAPWYARATLAFLHDTNYLRLADAQATPAGFTKADTVATGTLAAGFDQRFGPDPRGFYADAELRSSRLANNSAFDNQGWRLRAGLDWKAGRLFTGEVLVLTDRSLSPLDTSTTGTPGAANLVTLAAADAVFRVGYNVGFNAEAGVGWKEVDYSSPLFDNREYHEGSAFLGVRYRPTERSSIALRGRATRGSYPRYQALAGGGFVSDDYNGRFVDLLGTYRLTGKSELEARLSTGRTRHDNAVQSDLSGLTGEFKWSWTPTAKLALDTSLLREPSQDAFFLSTAPGLRPFEFSRVSTALRLGASYTPSARFRVDALLRGEHRELSQSVPTVGGGALVVNGNDRTLQGRLGLTWVPNQNLSLGCNIGHEVRRGQAPLSADVTSSRLGCDVTLSLEGRSLEGR